MKRFIFTALAAAVCAGANAQEAPTKPVETRLVQNGDFSQIQNGTPQNWIFSSANPEIYKTDVSPESAKSQNAVLHLTALDSKMSGYWVQTVKVKPHTRYELKTRAKLNSGKILIWVLGGPPEKRLDVRAYVEPLTNHPLVPLFWKLDWVNGSSSNPSRNLGPVRIYLAESNEWTNIAIPFDSGELSEVRINLGAYFAAGEYWFDDVAMNEIDQAEVKN